MITFFSPFIKLQYGKAFLFLLNFDYKTGGKNRLQRQNLYNSPSMSYTLAIGEKGGLNTKDGGVSSTILVLICLCSPMTACVENSISSLKKTFSDLHFNICWTLSCP